MNAGAIQNEIESLHAFFVEWFAGRLPNTDETFAHGFTHRLDSRLTYIMPDGTRQSAEALCQSLRQTHGSRPDFRITISDVQVHAEIDGVTLATYTEWQASMGDSQAAPTGRRATAVFTKTGEELRWLHVHETWLPQQ